MRLFLDAHVSGRRIAAGLREQGEDVRAADEERELDGSEDERPLELATAERRIRAALDARPDQDAWAGHVAWGTRAGGA